MNRSEIIQKTTDHVRGLLSGEGSGHDWFHVERVRNAAINIAREEAADLFIVELAALLHDVADWKFAGGDHDAGPEATRKWLTSLEVTQPLIDHVASIIAGLSFKGAGVETPMSTIEGRCVQDAYPAFRATPKSAFVESSAPVSSVRSRAKQKRR